MALVCSVIVCAYNEEKYLAGCLHSVLAQTRVPDEILVINNASTDATRVVATRIPGVRVVDEPRKGLVVARETGRLAARGDILAYIDADCRVPIDWLARIEREFLIDDAPVAVTAGYRYYDWDFIGRVLLRAYDFTLAPVTHVLAQDVFKLGAILYGGNFAVRSEALEWIGGFDTSIEFHGEDTNLARRLARVGRVRLLHSVHVYTSARRYQAMGRGKVFGLYIRNFCSEIFRHRPADAVHEDVRL